VVDAIALLTEHVSKGQLDRLTACHQPAPLGDREGSEKQICAPERYCFDRGSALSLPLALSAAHPRLNTAIGRRHAIEVCEHSLSLSGISLVGELAMQLLVTVRHSTVLGVEAVARIALVHGAVEIVSGFRQNLRIAADAVTPAVVALIPDLRRELPASVIETSRGYP
jgi:hypothetical protein